MLPALLPHLSARVVVLPVDLKLERLPPRLRSTLMPTALPVRRIDR